jgi:hypothetical protein
VGQPQQNIRLVAPLAEGDLIFRHRFRIAPGAEEAIASLQMVTHVSAATRSRRADQGSNYKKMAGVSQPVPSSPAAWVRGMLRKARALG